MKKEIALYCRIREILESARLGVARTVNTTQVIANWMIGREIVEEEQTGAKRAAYGAVLLMELSTRMTYDYGRGWSVRQLEYCRIFYQTYSDLLKNKKWNTVCSISSVTPFSSGNEISQKEYLKNWQPGNLHHNLSWSHYRINRKRHWWKWIVCWMDSLAS